MTGNIVAGKNNGGYNYGGIAEKPPNFTHHFLKIIKGQSPTNFINKFTFISGGSRDGSNWNLYTPRS